MTNPEVPANPAETGGWRSALVVAGEIVLTLTFIALIRDIFFPKKRSIKEPPPSRPGEIPEDIGGYQQRGGW